MFKNIYRKKNIFLLLVLLLLLPGFSFALEGDLVWERTENFTVGTWDYPHGISVDSTGVYVAGFENDYVNWRVEKRRLIDGSLLWEDSRSFGAGFDYALETVVDSTGLYTV